MNKKNTEKITTINDRYVVQEIKEGFDNFELGDTGVQIQMRPRTGVGKYTNFSKKCKVLVNSANSKYNIGDSVWVSHVIIDNKIDSRFLGEEYIGKDILQCGENNILFAGEDLTEIKSDEWVVFKIKKQEENKTASGIFCVTEESDEEGVVVCGALPEGTKITWFTSKRMEYYQKEIQYWVCHLENITTVDGITSDYFYKVDLFADYEYENKGIILKGQKAISTEVGIEVGGREKLMKLSNPNLEMDGNLISALKVKKCDFIRPQDIDITLGDFNEAIKKSKRIKFYLDS